MVLLMFIDLTINRWVGKLNHQVQSNLHIIIVNVGTRTLYNNIQLSSGGCIASFISTLPMARFGYSLTRLSALHTHL